MHRLEVTGSDDCSVAVDYGLATSATQCRFSLESDKIIC